MDYGVQRRSELAVTPPEPLDPALLGPGKAPEPDAEPDASKSPTPAKELPPAVLLIGAVLYLVMAALFWWGFGRGVDSDLSLGIADFVVLMFIAIPLTLAWAAGLFPKQLGEGWKALQGGSVETATGAVSWRTALILVLVVPVCLTLGAAAIALIFRILS